MRPNGCRFSYELLVLVGVALFILTETNDTYARAYFHMEKPLMGLGFSYEFDNDRQTVSGSTYETERHEFRERLSIESRGWVYHPNFWEYDFDFRPEFGQRREDLNSEKGSRDVYLQGYNLRSTFLPAKPYSMTLFGSRRNIPSLSAFSRVSETDITTFGANFNLKYSLLPTSLQYTRSEEKETGFYSSQENIDTWRLRTRHRSESSTTDLTAAYEERISTSGGFTSNIDSLDSSIRNTFFLADGKISFSSNLSQRLTHNDDVENSSIVFSENIEWKHRANLTSHYDLNYSRNTSDEFFNETRSLSAGLFHQLYENLTTNLSGDVINKEFSGGSENSYVGDLYFNYVRPIPWGTIGANMGFNYRLRRSIFDEEFIPVIDEPLVLSGFNFSFLEKKFIDIGSIRVTDIPGTRVYIKDLDYEVDEINFFVRIRRTVGSAIGDGEQVHVSYRYLSTSPSYDDATFRQSYGFNINLWSSLFFSYEYRHSKQKILSGIAPDIPEDDTEQRVAIELVWKFTDTTFSYEITDRTAGNSIEKWQVDEFLTFRPLEDLFFRLTGTLGHYEFKRGVTEEQDAYGFGFNIDWIPVRWGKLGLTGSRHIVSGDTTDTEDNEIKVVFQMSYSIWNGSLHYSYLLRQDNIADETRQINRLFFEIVRVNF